MIRKKQTFQCPVKNQLKQYISGLTPKETSDLHTDIKTAIQLAQSDKEINEGLVVLLDQILESVEKRQSSRSELYWNMKIILKIGIIIMLSLLTLTLTALLWVKPHFSIYLLAGYTLLALLFTFFFMSFRRVKDLSKSDCYNLIMFILTILSLGMTIYTIIEN